MRARRPSLFTFLAFATLNASCRDSVGTYRPPEQRLLPSTLLVWTAPGATATAKPAFDDARVYFLNALFGHVVTAVDKANGRILWRRDLVFQNSIDSLDAGFGLELVAGKLIVSDNELFALDPATGAVLWQVARRPSQGVGLFSRFTTDGVDFYPDMDAQVFRYDGATGALRWATNPTPGHRAAIFMPQVSEGVVYAGFSWVDSGRQGGASAIDAASGRVLWTFYVPRPDSIRTEVLRVGLTQAQVVVPAGDGNVYVLDRTTGELQMTIPQAVFYGQGPIPEPGREAYGIHSAAEGVFVVTFDGRITALNPSNFAILWTAMGLPSWVMELTSDERHLYVSYAGGQLYVFRITDGKVLWYVTGADLRPDQFEGTLRAPALDGEVLYMGGYGFASYAFRRR